MGSHPKSPSKSNSAEIDELMIAIASQASSEPGPHETVHGKGSSARTGLAEHPACPSFNLDRTQRTDLTDRTDMIGCATGSDGRRDRRGYIYHSTVDVKVDSTSTSLESRYQRTVNFEVGLVYVVRLTCYTPYTRNYTYVHAQSNGKVNPVIR